MSSYLFDVDHATEYGVDEAIMVANLQFWIRKNRADRRNYHDGKWWTYSSIRGFIEAFPFWNKDKIWRVIRSLEGRGVIRIGNHNKDPNDRTQWFAFVDQKRFLDQDPEGAADEAVAIRDSPPSSLSNGAGDTLPISPVVSDRDAQSVGVSQNATGPVAKRDALSQNATALPDKNTDSFILSEGAPLRSARDLTSAFVDAYGETHGDNVPAKDLTGRVAAWSKRALEQNKPFEVLRAVVEVAADEDKGPGQLANILGDFESGRRRVGHHRKVPAGARRFSESEYGKGFGEGAERSSDEDYGRGF